MSWLYFHEKFLKLTKTSVSTEESRLQISSSPPTKLLTISPALAAFRMHGDRAHAALAYLITSKLIYKVSFHRVVTVLKRVLLNLQFIDGFRLHNTLTRVSLFEKKNDYLVLEKVTGPMLR